MITKSSTRFYSNLFTTLYDQAAALPSPGRFTQQRHYSVFRTTEGGGAWRDGSGAVPTRRLHDFAVIWDEDHDERIIEIIERLYMTGLLHAVAFIGESQGVLSVLLNLGFFIRTSADGLNEYRKKVEALSTMSLDKWSVRLGVWVPPHSEEGAVSQRGTLLQSDLAALQGSSDHDKICHHWLEVISYQWDLGHKPYQRTNSF